jgi:hypothetical protein
MTSRTVWDRTALSPEGDRWFDEAFTDLISGDEDLVRAEFDALIAANWPPPPPLAVPPAPAKPSPRNAPPAATAVPKRAARKGGDRPASKGCQRSPPTR